VEGRQRHPFTNATIQSRGDRAAFRILRLIFTACHPVLTLEARTALTLRLICGLTTEEIARAFLVRESSSDLLSLLSIMEPIVPTSLR
jgi:predicted RNA polymerase sigma factor